jgi:hypothetical protein
MSQTEPSDRHLLDRRFADPLEQRPVPVIDQQRIDRVWRRLQEAEATTRRRPGWTWRLTKMAVPVALATAIAALLLLRRSPDGGVLLAVAPEIALTPGSELVGDSQREDLELRDGSRLQLGSGVRLQILENDSQRFVTQLHQGLVRFQVRPGGRRRWTIETALATIEVVGTVFTVERDLYEVRIAVERGTVIVRGEGVPGRVARLLANQQLVVQARPQTPSSPSFEPPARELPASPPSNISPERANSGESDTAQIVTSPAGAPTVPSVSREPSLVRPPLRRVRRPDAQPSAPPAASPNSPRMRRRVSLNSRWAGSISIVSASRLGQRAHSPPCFREERRNRCWRMHWRDTVRRCGRQVSARPRAPNSASTSGRILAGHVARRSRCYWLPHENRSQRFVRSGPVLGPKRSGMRYARTEHCACASGPSSAP